MSKVPLLFQRRGGEAGVVWLFSENYKENHPISLSTDFSSFEKGGEFFLMPKYCKI